MDFDTAETLQKCHLPRTCRILELAAKQVQRQGADQITPEHLLLGILQEGETGGGLAMRVLQACHVDCDRLQQQLM